MSNTSIWEFDHSSKRIKHENGLCLEIEGNPKDPSAITPTFIPDGLSSVELVSLIREGTEYCRKNYTSDSAEKKPSKPKIDPPNPSGRPVLRLKR